MFSYDKMCPLVADEAFEEALVRLERASQVGMGGFCLGFGLLRAAISRALAAAGQEIEREREQERERERESESERARARNRETYTHRVCC